MKMWLLVASVVLLLMACGDLFSSTQRNKSPGYGEAPHEAQTSIERTIENFTLGMEKDEALRLFTDSLKQQDFSMLYMVSIFPDQIESLKKIWTAHVYPDVLFRKGFIEREFNHRPSSKELVRRFDVSEAFKSNTTKLIRLSFYNDKLFKIDIVPLVQYNAINQALKDKYGIPNAVFPRVDEWIDQTTLIRVFKPGVDTNDSVLFYIDRSLYALLRQEAAAIKEALDDEEQRRKSTLPKQY